ncbi:uncharacterized protein MONBRDRAFT_30109 [Monosiga brevicollis MX1]|uniref:Uncharacterized protein n=1 Tax=Monosiga brevicollis TaxID=81824 RepID=A9VD20_MONBE|nr:uncharacterized protein MONBRDRAFT_30109 [Monosiga brevicollis MX1]EDQ84567.1 predicted protein [Monosiga brevicollis MX1]|eukprot:XP_001750594.1 hypothetical protein [Monosiga brevicollis MX1]
MELYHRETSSVILTQEICIEKKGGGNTRPARPQNGILFFCSQTVTEDQQPVEPALHWLSCFCTDRSPVLPPPTALPDGRLTARHHQTHVVCVRVRVCCSLSLSQALSLSFSLSLSLFLSFSLSLKLSQALSLSSSQPLNLSSSLALSQPLSSSLSLKLSSSQPLKLSSSLSTSLNLSLSLSLSLSTSLSQPLAQACNCSSSCFRLAVPPCA